MSQDQNITVTVVVSGQAVPVKVNVHQSIEHLVAEALKDTGNKGQPPGDWELRTSDGALIEQTLIIGAVGLKQDATVYLSPRAGAGGE